MKIAETGLHISARIRCNDVAAKLAELTENYNSVGKQLHVTRCDDGVIITLSTGDNISICTKE